MQNLLRSILVVVVLAPLAGFGSPALAQTGSGPASNQDRLFLAFIEDATLAQHQWWEGQIEISDGLEVPGGDLDAVIVRGIVAFQPWIDVELGVRVGFGSTDGPVDGSGATDLEAWGKYYLESQSQNVQFAFGGVVTIPTGDETAGLGEDSFGSSAFGSIRYRLDRLILAGHLGVQFNGDGRQFGQTADRDGETALQLGGGVIYPFSGSVSGIAEISFDGGRLDRSDDNLRVLGGINWRVGGRSNLRGALTFGLDDGAPDAQILLSYATQF